MRYASTRTAQVKLHDPKAFSPEETLKTVVYLYQKQLAEQKPDSDELCVIIDRTDAKSSNMVRARGPLGGEMEEEGLMVACGASLFCADTIDEIQDVEFLKLLYKIAKDAFPAR